MAWCRVAFSCIAVYYKWWNMNVSNNGHSVDVSNASVAPSTPYIYSISFLSYWHILFVFSRAWIWFTWKLLYKFSQIFIMDFLFIHVHSTYSCSQMNYTWDCKLFALPPFIIINIIRNNWFNLYYNNNFLLPAVLNSSLAST